MSPFLRPRPVSDPLVRLFVFHHAGGSASAYHPLAGALPADWEVVLVDLPGHGRRHAEPPVPDMARLVDVVAREVAPHAVADQAPYALFGHSMGAVVAAEVGRRLAEGFRPPAWVGVSGRSAPLAERPAALWSELSDAQLSTVLLDLGGIPAWIRGEPDLFERFLRLARADLEALGTCTVDPDRTRLPCPLTAFGGLTDRSAPPSSLPAWKHETAEQYRQCFLPGGHFYFLGAFPALAGEIRYEVRSALGRASAAVYDARPV
ncbi:MAG TPA: alpha/beta fold hydrolase [Actinocrinis sp.]|nr:alpha/beta fold hydrolase [Actinocrinis sp.]